CRRVLRTMTRELFTACSEIARLERYPHRQQRLGHAVHCWICARCGAQPLTWQRRIKEIDVVREPRVALHDLGDDIADETVIGMTRPTLGPEGDDRRRFHGVEDR